MDFQARTVRAWKMALVASGVAAAGRAYEAYSVLPAKIAVHFSAGGRPGAWASSEAAMAFFVGLTAAFTLLFLFLPRLVFWLPLGIVNFPKKEHWLDPSRRERHFPMIAPWFYAPGVLINFLFLGMVELTYAANRDGEARLDEARFFAFFGAFLVCFFLWLGLFFRRFSKIPKEA